jgi:hypothetical protein
MAKKRISVISTTNTGKNTVFHDNFKNKNMTIKQFVSEIKKGNYDNYHIRVIKGIETPVSNPDNSANNNLG